MTVIIPVMLVVAVLNRTVSVAIDTSKYANTRSRLPDTAATMFMPDADTSAIDTAANLTCSMDADGCISHLLVSDVATD